MLLLFPHCSLRFCMLHLRMNPCVFSLHSVVYCSIWTFSYVSSFCQNGLSFSHKRTQCFFVIRLARVIAYSVFRDHYLRFIAHFCSSSWKFERLRSVLNYWTHLGCRHLLSLQLAHSIIACCIELHGDRYRKRFSSGFSETCRLYKLRRLKRYIIVEYS